MRTLNLTRVLLSLIGVTLLTLAAAARTDADTGGLVRVGQAVATVAAHAGSSVTPSEEPGVKIAAITTAAVNAAQLTPAASASNAAQGAPSSEQGAARPSEASGTPVSPPSAPAPGASTTSISEAVQEAIGQAASSRYGSGGDAAGTIAAESNATTQLIWQLQMSECTAHCSDTEQYQTAQQQSTTHQALAGAPVATGAGAPATDERSQATASVTQIQLGCISHCAGTTTTTAGAAVAANIQQALEALLHQIAAALPGLSPTPAADQNAVAQISYQSQSEADGSLVQTQSVSQASTTTQAYDAPSALIAELESALSGPQAASYEVVNQTEQGIWQLQIGCLMFCEDTEQYQQAEQSNTTLQTVVSAPGSGSSTPATLTDTATQLIWQAQIGCLMWCLDAVEQQSASAENTLAVSEGEETAATAPAETTSKSPGKGSGPAPPNSAADGSQASPTGPTGPPSSGSGSATTVLLAPPATPALGSIALAGVTSPKSLSKPPLNTHRSHISTARASMSPVRGSHTVVRAKPATPRAHQRRGLASHRSAGPAPASFGAVTAGTTLGSQERADLSTPAAVLLAAIALFALCCLGIVALRTRQGSRARPADN